ncbi:MAG: sigma-70 family RNA polymerase sigma factor [Gemmataceae bacterium]|nr:sigma-70 family RNA polymerase sigma factor [Gemmataceae bacterium]
MARITLPGAAVDADELNRRLSQIPTCWSLLRLAHAPDEAAARAAQQLLLARYGGAVRRYLGRAVPDPHAAADVFQEFAVSLLRGKLRTADPGRGRFRDYVKKVLRNLLAKHRKKAARRPPPPGTAVAPSPADDIDAELDGPWPAGLLARAWAALEDAQPLLYAALRFRADHPDVDYPNAATRVGATVGRPITPEALRQAVHRARRHFALLLVDGVGHTLKEPTAAAVERELADLELLEYCRPVLGPGA